MIRLMLRFLAPLLLATMVVAGQATETSTSGSSQSPDSRLLTTPCSAAENSSSLPGTDSVGPVTMDTVDLSDRTVIFTIDDGYHSVFTNAYPLFKKHDMPFTLGVITDYVRSGKPSYEPAAGFMKRSEIQELIDSLGIEIASHS